MRSTHAVPTRLSLVALLSLLLTPGSGALSSADVRSVRVGGTVIELVNGRGSLWALVCDQRCSGEARRSVGRVVRIDPHCGRIQATGQVPDPGALAVGAEGVFATDFWGNAVRKLDPVSLRVIASVPLVLPFEVAPGDNAFAPDGLPSGTDRSGPSPPAASSHASRPEP